jgi:hypothetical protein
MRGELHCGVGERVRFGDGTNVPDQSEVRIAEIADALGQLGHPAASIGRYAAHDREAEGPKLAEKREQFAVVVHDGVELGPWRLSDVGRRPQHER